MQFIPYGHQHIEQTDIDAVIEALKSDWLTQGPFVNAFEEMITAYCGAIHAIAVCNATAALHLAYLALELGTGDILWTTPNTFVATANAALHCGATVDFVDIDPKTYNMCPLALADKLKNAAKINKLPKIVVPVHFAGQSCDMQAIKNLADKYGFKIVEDASHAIGGTYKKSPIGNCHYSDIAIFSLHPVKIITTGEGGVAVTNDVRLAQKMRSLRAHGIVRDESQMSEQSHGAWYYQQIYLGFNYRITDLQCALGSSQLKRIDQFVQRRNVLAARYHDNLSKLPFILPVVQPDNYSTYHLYVIQVDPSKTNVTRKELFDHLRSVNIGANVHYIPIHLQPYYRQFRFKENDFPIAESYYKYTITLPLYYSLTEHSQDFIVQQLKLGLQNGSACHHTS